MQGFRSPGAAQRFLSLHAATYNAFNTRRHLNSAANHRDCRREAFAPCREGPRHLLLGHILPLVIVAAFGALAGRLLLRP